MLISSEISVFSKYFDHFIQYRTLGFDHCRVFELIKCRKKTLLEGSMGLNAILDPENRDARNLVFMNGVFNQNFDIRGILLDMKPLMSRGDRVGVLLFNSYFMWVYKLMNKLSLRKSELPKNFLTRASLENLAAISGFEIVKMRTMVYFPFSFFGIGTVVNSILSVLPVIRWFGFTTFVMFRPVKPSGEYPSLSVVIPARNEKGNIENALKRVNLNPGIEVEIVFVEGGSTDGTWEEIQRVIPLYSDKFTVKAYKQSNSGKANAVREGFEKCSGELLTILDADLTMPPERLGDFYDVWCSGAGDFVNGSRLLYPMEKEAMRYLNHLGNIFFAKALSWLLESRFGDSLCGTKLVSKRDYKRFTEWRQDFGDFDPFGDFELLFPAAILGLGTRDVPVKYAARTYGETNISRFRHGVVLLKMTIVGFFRIRLAKFPGFR